MNRFVRECLAILLGVATSVVITWSLSIYRCEWEGTTTWTRYPGDLAGWACEFAGVSQIQVTDCEDTGNYSGFTPAELSQPNVVAPAIEYARDRFLEDESPAAFPEYVVAAGWPWRCLWYHAHEIGAIGLPHLALDDPGINLDPDADPDVTRKLRVLPLRPLWLGLAGNVAFYGAIWFLLLSVPAIRRAMRRWRGCCGTCGYMLRGITSATCPECGTATTAASRRASAS